MRSNCTSPPGVPLRCAGRHQRRHDLGFGLVDLDVLLQGMDEVLPHVLGRKALVGDLAQGDDGILVVVAIDRDRGSRRDHAGPMTGEQDQVEPVLNLVDAILNGDACHLMSWLRVGVRQALELSK